MTWQPFQVLVLCCLILALCPCGSKETESKSRRLRGSTKHTEFERRLKVVSTEPAWVDAKGIYPLLGLGNFELKNVLAIDKERPWLLSHTEYSDEFHARRRLLDTDSVDNDIAEVRNRLSRRLQSTQNDGFPDTWALDFIQSEDFKEAISAAFAFRTPRERLRVMAVLSAAALPEAALTNTTHTFLHAPLVYLEDKQGFSKNDTELNHNRSILDVIDDTTGEAVGANQSEVNRAYRDGVALKQGRTALRTYVGADWNADKFQGQRSTDCSTRTAEDEKCFLDIGVALSIYQNDDHKMFIFHSDWSVYEKEYYLWAYRAWIIDNMEKQVADQWTIDSRQAMTSEMSERRGTILQERLERCAYKDTIYQPVSGDMAAFGKDNDISEAELEASGLWGIVKSLVRVVLPAERDRVLELVRSNYFVGSGMGGYWAALTSMWLKKVDDATYNTFVINGYGWQCASRALITEMNPSETHAQINVYSHMMNTFAKMGRVAGYVCNYGSTNFTEALDAAYTYCSGIVGFSGPQLLYRGPPTPDDPMALEENIYAGSDQERKVQEARKAFDACHYYTNSMYYTAVQWLNDRILMPDGTTDAGCTTVDPVPAEDTLGQCPSAATVDQECLEIIPNVQALPVVAMTVVAGGLGGIIVCIGIVGWAMLKRIRNDMWVFGTDTKAARANRLGIVEQILRPLGFRFTELKKKDRRRAANKGERAKIARERAREARQKKFKGDLRKQAAEEDGTVEVFGFEAIKGKAEDEDEENGKGKGKGKAAQKSMEKQNSPADGAASATASTKMQLAQKAAVQSERDRLLPPMMAGVVGAASDEGSKKPKRNSARSAERGRPGSSTDPAPDASSNTKLKVPGSAKGRTASHSPRGSSASAGGDRERRSVKFKAKPRASGRSM